MNGFPLYMPHLEWWYSTPSTGFIELVTVLPGLCEHQFWSCFVHNCAHMYLNHYSSGYLVLRQLGFFPFRQKQWPFHEKEALTISDSFTIYKVLLNVPASLVKFSDKKHLFQPEGATVGSFSCSSVISWKPFWDPLAPQKLQTCLGQRSFRWPRSSRHLRQSRRRLRWGVLFNIHLPTVHLSVEKFNMKFMNLRSTVPAEHATKTSCCKQQESHSWIYGSPSASL